MIIMLVLPERIQNSDVDLSTVTKCYTCRIIHTPVNNSANKLHTLTALVQKMCRYL